VSLSMRYMFAWALGATFWVGGAHEISAQQRGGGRGAPMTPLVYRQNMMEQLQQSLSAMTAIRNGTVGTPADLVGRATIIRELATALSSAFPAGSGGGDSRALPAVWDNAGEFADQVQATQSAADALLAAARGGDTDAVGTAQTALQQACGACHQAFRAQPAAGRGGAGR
jgi:cytochrome c556